MDEEHREPYLENDTACLSWSPTWRAPALNISRCVGREAGKELVFVAVTVDIVNTVLPLFKHVIYVFGF